jgi:sugar fermentation stimulation protein A
VTCPYFFSKPLLPGILLRRYKRFFADIQLETGQEIVAHCANTGPMTGVCHVGSLVQVSEKKDPRRKLAYSWEMICIDNTWVGINTSLPNRLVQFGLEHHWFPELAGFLQMQREVTYGSQKSKIDFLLTYPNQKSAYVEVKNTTWSQGNRALFPDTVTTRGQKHLQELTAVVQSGQRAVMVYLINRGDCTEFAPGESKDPTYGRLFREALAAGVEVLPYRLAVDPVQVQCLGLAQLILD